jgi:hypothetical protein
MLCEGKPRCCQGRNYLFEKSHGCDHQLCWSQFVLTIGIQLLDNPFEPQDWGR